MIRPFRGNPINLITDECIALQHGRNIFFSEKDETAGLVRIRPAGGENGDRRYIYETPTLLFIIIEEIYRIEEPEGSPVQIFRALGSIERVRHRQ